MNWNNSFHEHAESKNIFVVYYKNAYEAYEQISGLDPYSVKDLLLAHKWMMEGLVDHLRINWTNKITQTCC